MAKAADEAGYHAMTIADSVAYPEVSDLKYPYTEDGNREFLDGKPFIESFALIGALSAVTTKLHFNIFVLKLPIRPPALVAKQAGSWPHCSATGSTWASAPARGRRTTNSWACRSPDAASGWTSASTWSGAHLRRLLRVPR